MKGGEFYDLEPESCDVDTASFSPQDKAFVNSEQIEVCEEGCIQGKQCMLSRIGGFASPVGGFHPREEVGLVGGWVSSSYPG